MPTAEMPIVAFAAFVCGAVLVATVCFLRWRFHKQIVPSSYWKRLMDDYGSMEQAVNASASSEFQVRLAHDELASHHAAITNENKLLNDQLQSLQTDLALVTNEATLLVDGLRDNEERWASAEDLRTELEFTVGQLHEAKKLLEEKLSHRNEQLRSAKLTIDELGQLANRSAVLETQLGEAAERNRGQVAVIARLERLGGETNDQLRAVTRRAETAQRQLHKLGSPDRPDILRSRGAFEQEIDDDGRVEETIIDLDELQSDSAASTTPRRRTFDRGRSLHDRLQRSYGRLPTPD